MGIDVLPLIEWGTPHDSMPGRGLLGCLELWLSIFKGREGPIGERSRGSPIGERTRGTWGMSRMEDCSTVIP